MRKTLTVTAGLCLLVLFAAAPLAAEGDALGDARTLFLKGEYEKAAAALG